METFAKHNIIRILMGTYAYLHKFIYDGIYK